MLTLDGEGRERWWQEERKESLTERREREMAEELQRHEVTVEQDGSRDRSELLAQLGTPMTCQQVMAKLRLCNPRLHFERSLAFPHLMGVYLLAPEMTPAGTTVLQKKHLFGMEAGIMPEFTVIHKIKIPVANRELFGRKEATRDVPWKMVETYRDQTRGWRTVLLRLLHAKLITRGDVERHFGWAPSHDSRRWYEHTK